MASITKAAYCLTTKQLSSILPNNCKPIEVDNVLISTAIITKIFYPDSVTDDFDPQTENIEKIFKVNVTKINIINKQNRTKVARGKKVNVKFILPINFYLR